MVPTSSSGDPLEQARSKLRGSLLTIGCGLMIIVIPAVAFAVLMSPLLFEMSEQLGLIPLSLFILPFIGLLLYQVWNALRTVRALAEISNQALASIPGEVTWTGRAYVIRAEGLKLRLLPGVELMPGRYAFTYLPNTGFVVEAKPTGSVDREAVTSALGAVFNFTPEDLAALRAGQIAPDHRARLRRNLVNGIFGAVLGGVGFAALGLVLASVLADSEGTGVAIGIAAGGTSLALLVVAASNGWQWRALNQGEVGVVEGPVREWTSGSRSRSYWFDVAGKRFRVSAAAHTALVQGQHYRVYYLKGNNQILGLEPFNQP